MLTAVKTVTILIKLCRQKQRRIFDGEILVIDNSPYNISLNHFNYNYCQKYPSFRHDFLEELLSLAGLRMEGRLLYFRDGSVLP